MAVDKNLQRDASIDAELSGTTVYLLWLSYHGYTHHGYTYYGSIDAELSGTTVYLPWLYLLWLYLPWLQSSHCGCTYYG